AREVLIRLDGERPSRVLHEFGKVPKMRNVCGFEPHHFGTNKVEGKKIVARDELGEITRCSTHRAVLIKPIKGVNDPVPSVNRLGNQGELAYDVFVLQQSQVLRITPPQVLNGESNRRN